MKLPRSHFILATAIALGMLSVVPASAANVPSSFTIAGSGNGHGVGLSQWGAQSMALAGKTYQQILANYYPGTTLSSQTFGTIDVNLEPKSSYMYFRGEDNPIDTGVAGNIIVNITASNGVIYNEYLPPLTPVVFQNQGSTFTGTVNGKNYTATAVKLTWDNKTTLVNINSSSINTKPSAVLDLGTCTVSSCAHRYKYGTIQLVLSSGLNAINRLLLDTEYMYGIGEVYSDWATEAFKAQIVAARGYAAFQTFGPICQCHVFTSTASQSFIGFIKEIYPNGNGERWKSAVNATATQILKYNGNIARTYYAASTGGWTQPVSEVWGSTAFPYLAKADDSWSMNIADSRQTFKNWSVSIDQATLVSRLRAEGLQITDIASIAITGKTASGAVNQLTIKDSKGSNLVVPVAPGKSVTPDELRTIFRAYSTYFKSITSSTTTTGVTTTSPSPSASSSTSLSPSPSVSTSSSASASPTTVLSPSPVLSPSTVSSPSPSGSNSVSSSPASTSIASPSPSTLPKARELNSSNDKKVNSLTSVVWQSGTLWKSKTIVSGKVYPIIADVVVKLQIQRDSKWVTIASDTTGNKGIWSLRWLSANKGTYKMRIVAVTELNAVYTSTKTLIISRIL